MPATSRINTKKQATKRAHILDEVSINLLFEISEKKKVKYRDLRVTFNNVGEEEMKQALTELKTKSLIGVVESQLTDFDTYYLTARGAHLVQSLETYRSVMAA